MYILCRSFTCIILEDKDMAPSIKGSLSRSLSLHKSMPLHALPSPSPWNYTVILTPCELLKISNQQTSCWLNWALQYQMTHKCRWVSDSDPNGMLCHGNGAVSQTSRERAPMMVSHERWVHFCDVTAEKHPASVVISCEFFMLHHVKELR